MPRLSDISVCSELLNSVGCKVTREENGDIAIDSTTVDNPFGDYEIVRRMRASICVLGPLLARCGRAEVSMPGGCAIGDRPVDIHIRALKELGARIYLKNGYIVAEAPNGLKGKELFMGGPFGSTVLGTGNVLMAAVTAKGRTVLESAACEPEVTDLANFLNKMGAKISGMGSPRLGYRWCRATASGRIRSNPRPNRGRDIYGCRRHYKRRNQNSQLPAR